MPYVHGFLKIRGEGHADQDLPGMEGPTDPGYGHDLGGIPGNLPAPPLGVWPPPSASHPVVPAPPGTPPGAIWPSPGHPPIWSGGVVPPPHPGGGPMPGNPARPGNALPTPPATGGTPLPSGVFWVVAGIPGVGWRYCAVDPSLVAGTPLPPEPVPEPK